MSNTSKTPAIMSPHETGEITLTKAIVEFKDTSGNPCWDKYEWVNSDDDSPRVDVRESYPNYSEDQLYSPVDTCEVSLTFSADTEDCLMDIDDEFQYWVKIISSASKYQIVRPGVKSKRGKYDVTMAVTLLRDEFLNLKGLVECEIILIKSGDGTSVGTNPVKTTSGVFATSDGAILATSDSDSTLQIVLDDPSAPTSKGMELEWIDMSDTPNAQYVLNYFKCENPNETNFKITLQLNDKSHLFSLRNALGGRKKDLKKLVISQISSTVSMNLLYDLCNTHEAFIQSVIDGTATPVDDSLLEFCISVLTGVAKSISMDYEEIFSAFVGDIDKVREIALKIQNSKAMDALLTELVSSF